MSVSPPSTPPPGQQPVLLARLLLAAEQDPLLPANQRRHADPGLVGIRSVPRGAEAANAALGLGKLLDLDELDLRDREHHELRDPHARLDR